MQTINKAQQIRAFLNSGSTPKEAAEKANVKLQYVYDVRSKDRLKDGVKTKKRAKANSTKVVDDAQIAQETRKLDGMKKYIIHLETELLMRDGAINALRNKLYAAAV